jgi:hypothetical protein
MLVKLDLWTVTAALQREAGEALFLSQFYAYIQACFVTFGGTRWRSWLRNYVTSRKVVGSIPDEVIGFFI